MNYSLAKELKEAGFSQKGKGETVHQKSKCKYPKLSTNCYLYIPTLSELIEACGEDFQKLETIVGDMWQGVGGKGIRDIEVEGKTPEEAIARLWLALNKKND